MAEHILTEVASVNPYNKLAANAKPQYDIYQAGFLAGYLASLMAEDPFIYKRFIRHLEGCRKKTAKRG